MAEICERHNVLKRSCYICDLEEETKELREKLMKVHGMLITVKEVHRKGKCFTVNGEINKIIEIIEEE